MINHLVTFSFPDFLHDHLPCCLSFNSAKLNGWHGFFYSTANRDAFLMSRSAALAAAAANWPGLAKGLSGPRDEVPVSNALPAEVSASAEPSVAPPEQGANVGANTDSASSETPHG